MEHLPITVLCHGNACQESGLTLHCEPVGSWVPQGKGRRGFGALLWWRRRREATFASYLHPLTRAQQLHPFPDPKKRWKQDGSPPESRLGLVRTKPQQRCSHPDNCSPLTSLVLPCPPVRPFLGAVLREPTIHRLLEVYVGITQRPARGHVPAHSDGHDGPSRGELLVEHGFSHIWVQVSHIERG